jgi:hypothetical protein
MKGAVVALGVALGAGLCFESASASAVSSSPGLARALDEAQFNVLEHSGGRCVNYTGEYPGGGLCKSSGLVGKMVWMFDGDDARNLDIAVRDRQFTEYYEALKRAAQAVAGMACVEPYLMLVCYAWFMPCNSDGVPMKPCMSSCVSMVDKCAAAFSIAEQANLGYTVVKCDEPIGDPRTASVGTVVDYLSPWKGLPKFEAAEYSESALPGKESVVQCADTKGLNLASKAMCSPEVCPEPMVEARYPVPANATGLD